MEIPQVSENTSETCRSSLSLQLSIDWKMCKSVSNLTLLVFSLKVCSNCNSEIYRGWHEFTLGLISLRLITSARESFSRRFTSDGDNFSQRSLFWGVVTYFLPTWRIPHFRRSDDIPTSDIQTSNHVVPHFCRDSQVSIYLWWCLMFCFHDDVWCVVKSRTV